MLILSVVIINYHQIFCQPNNLCFLFSNFRGGKCLLICSYFLKILKIGCRSPPLLYEILLVEAAIYVAFCDVSFDIHPDLFIPSGASREHLFVLCEICNYVLHNKICAMKNESLAFSSSKSLKLS